MSGFLLACCILLITGFGYRAEAFVYLPGTSSGSSGTLARALTPSVLPGSSTHPLIKEKVNINGVPLTLEIYQLNARIDDLFAAVCKKFKPEKMEYGKDYLRAVFRVGKHKTERWLFIFSGANRPITAFRMELSGNLPRPAHWPSELPALPPGCRINMVMELPRLNAVFGSFDQNESSGIRQLPSYTTRLASSGWVSAGAEHSPSIMGSGEIYFRNNPSRQILWIKFGEEGGGAFYLKKIK